MHDLERDSLIGRRWPERLLLLDPELFAVLLQFRVLLGDLAVLGVESLRHGIRFDARGVGGRSRGGRAFGCGRLLLRRSFRLFRGRALLLVTRRGDRRRDRAGGRRASEEGLEIPGLLHAPHSAVAHAERAVARFEDARHFADHDPVAVHHDRLVAVQGRLGQGTAVLDAGGLVAPGDQVGQLPRLDPLPLDLDTTAVDVRFRTPVSDDAVVAGAIRPVRREGGEGEGEGRDDADDGPHGTSLC